MKLSKKGIGTGNMVATDAWDGLIEVYYLTGQLSTKSENIFSSS